MNHRGKNRVLRGSLQRYGLILLWSLLFFQISEHTFAQTNSDSENRILQELSRNWKIAILPFASDDNAVLRTVPLLQSLPSIIQEGLSPLQERSLSNIEIEYYTSWLLKNFTNGDEPEILNSIIGGNPPFNFPPEIPKYRKLEYKITEIENTTVKQLYLRAFRDFLNEEKEIPHSILSELQNSLEADLFIAGSIQVQDQYAFIDLILISPYITNTNKVLSKHIFSLRNNELLGEVESSIVLELGKSIFNAESGGIRVSDPENRLIRVYVDNLYWGTVPLLVSPLAVGQHKINLFEGEKLIQSSDLIIVQNSILEFEVPTNEANLSQFAFNTSPPGLNVYENSRLLGSTPLLLDRVEEIDFLQILGEGIRDSYVQIGAETPGHLSVSIPSNSFDLGQQIALDREQFYGSLGLTLISGIVPLLLTGLAADRMTVNTSSWSQDQRQTFLRDSQIISTFAISGLVFVIISFVNTLDNLFDYLNKAEIARSVIRPDL